MRAGLPSRPSGFSPGSPPLIGLFAQRIDMRVITMSFLVFFGGLLPAHRSFAVDFRLSSSGHGQKPGDRRGHVLFAPLTSIIISNEAKDIANASSLLC